jgi:hypothetical protein
MEKEEVQNDSDRNALMYYTIAHDKSELSGARRSAKQMYELKYGSIDEPFGWNPKLTVGMYSIGAVQPIVGGTLKAWSWVLGWLFGHGG